MPDSFCSFWTPKPFQAMVEVGRWVWWVWLSTPTAPAKPHSTRPCPHLLLNLGAGRGWVRLTKLVISRGSELILVCPGISVCPGLAELDIVRVTPPPPPAHRKISTWTLSNSDIVWVTPPPHTHTPTEIFELGHCPTQTLSNLDIVRVTPPPLPLPTEKFQLGHLPPLADQVDAMRRPQDARRCVRDVTTRRRPRNGGLRRPREGGGR